MSHWNRAIDHTDPTNLCPGDDVFLRHPGRENVRGTLVGMQTAGLERLTEVTLDRPRKRYAIAPDAYQVVAVTRALPPETAPDRTATKVPDVDDVLTEADLRVAELSVITLPEAARDVVDHQGGPGGMARHARLLDVVTQIRTLDPHADVLISAAVWLDRRGSAGAPDRLRFLADAVDRADPSEDAS